MIMLPIKPYQSRGKRQIDCSITRVKFSLFPIFARSFSSKLAQHIRTQPGPKFFTLSLYCIIIILSRHGLFNSRTTTPTPTETLWRRHLSSAANSSGAPRQPPVLFRHRRRALAPPPPPPAHALPPHAPLLLFLLRRHTSPLPLLPKRHLLWCLATRLRATHRSLGSPRTRQRGRVRSARALRPSSRPERFSYS